MATAFFFIRQEFPRARSTEDLLLNGILLIKSIELFTLKIGDLNDATQVCPAMMAYSYANAIDPPIYSGNLAIASGWTTL
jgi:hypothetical protein